LCFVVCSRTGHNRPKLFETIWPKSKSENGSVPVGRVGWRRVIHGYLWVQMGGSGWKVSAHRSPNPNQYYVSFLFFTIIVSLNILVGPNKPYFSLFKAKVLHFHSFSNPSKPRTQRRLLHTTLSLFVHFFHSLVHISSPSFFQSMRISLSLSLSLSIYFCVCWDY
jgi:hypothetical protein